MNNKKDYVLINLEKNSYKIYNIQEIIEYNPSLYKNNDYYSKFNYYYTEMMNAIKDVVYTTYQNSNSFSEQSLFNMVSSL